MDGKDDGAPVTWIIILNLLNGPLFGNKALAMKIYKSLKKESSNEQIAQGKYTLDLLTTIGKMVLKCFSLL